MARVTADTVAHVARLARLSLAPDEQQAFTLQLEGILEYAASIQALDTTGIPPMSHAAGEGALRADEVAPSLATRTALGTAPDAADGLFRVPRIIG